jgi:hypothetical protein
LKGEKRGGEGDDGHAIERHVERRGRKEKKKSISEKVGYCRHRRGRKILATDSCRGSAARAMQASQPDPQRSTVEFEEARGWNETQQACQRGGSHGSEARIEGKE